MRYKDDFEIFKNNPDLVYLDSSATSLKPKRVVDKVLEYYNSYTANFHRGDYNLSIKVDQLCEETRDLVKNLINAKDRREIVFTSGTTEGLNLIANNYFKKVLKKDDEVILSKAEHASNFIPWLKLKEEIGIKLVFVNLDDNQELDYQDLENKINDKTKVISLAHITNTLGDIRDLEKIASLIKDKDIKFVVDAAQSIGHIKVDVEKYNIDFLAFSTHKMYGETGSGVLYAKLDLLEEMDPYKYGGGMNFDFNQDEYSYKEIPYKFEGGTPNISGIISLGEAIKYINEIGLDNIINYISDLSKYLFKRIKEVDNLEIYNYDHKTGILIFNVKDVFPQDLSIFLNQYNICIRSGDHCVKTLNQIIKTRNTGRVSLNIYNTYEDIDKLIDALNDQDKIFDNII